MSRPVIFKEFILQHIVHGKANEKLGFENTRERRKRR
jgi:hypothetical protein